MDFSLTDISHISPLETASTAPDRHVRTAALSLASKAEFATLVWAPRLPSRRCPTWYASSATQPATALSDPQDTPGDVRQELLLQPERARGALDRSERFLLNVRSPPSSAIYNQHKLISLPGQEQHASLYVPGRSLEPSVEVRLVQLATPPSDLGRLGSETPRCSAFARSLERRQSPKEETQGCDMEGQRPSRRGVSESSGIAKEHQ